MRTIKDPKKKPVIRQRVEPLAEATEEELQLNKCTPPKKRKTAKTVKDDYTALNDSGSFADNYSDIVSEKSSTVGDDDASDISSLKSTPPKKRNYNRILKSPETSVVEVNGDAHSSPESTPEKKGKGKKKNKMVDVVQEDEAPGKQEMEKKSPRSKKATKSPITVPVESQEQGNEECEKKLDGAKKKEKLKGKMATAESETKSVKKKDTTPRKRKLSGPQGDASANSSTGEKKIAVEKKTPKKSKKLLSKEEEQVELKRQTEELRSDKVYLKNGELEPKPKVKKTPAKKSPGSPKQASPKQLSPKQASPRQAFPKQASPKQASPKQASPKQISPTKSVSNNETHTKDKLEHTGKHDLSSESETDMELDEQSSELETSFDSINSHHSEELKPLDTKPEDNDKIEKSETVVTDTPIAAHVEQSIRCEHCGYISRSKGGHTRHLRKCQPEQFGLEPESASKPKIHECEQCDYSAPKRVMVINHMYIHGIFLCKRCKFRTDSEEILTDHCALEHKDRTDCKFCKNCNRYVKCSEVPLEKHMEECQGRIPFKCPECSKEFQYESSLKCHVVSHYPDKPKLFSCNQCDYKSNYKANLKKHIRHIHEQRGERSIQCPQCEKTFFTEDNMKRHLKLHSENRPYKCDKDNCDKAFKTLTGLKLHEVSHRTDRPFPCDYESCDKSFKTKRLLMLHRNETHQNAPRNHKCTEEGCEMAFYKKCHLDRHIDAHKDNRTHFCTFLACTKAFRTADSLKVHLLLHQDLKPLKCEHCDYTCRQKASIRFHMKKKHPELVNNDLTSVKSLKKKKLKVSNMKGPGDKSDSIKAETVSSGDRNKASDDLDTTGQYSDSDSSIHANNTQLNSHSWQTSDQTRTKVDLESTNVSDKLDTLIPHTAVSSANQTPIDLSKDSIKPSTLTPLLPKKSLINEIESKSEAANEIPLKKPKRTDMYDFQSEDESDNDHMKPGLLRRDYNKDQPPLPRVDPKLLEDLKVSQGKVDEKPKEAEKPKKAKKKPGPKAKPKPEKTEEPEKDDDSKPAEIEKPEKTDKKAEKTNKKPNKNEKDKNEKKPIVEKDNKEEKKLVEEKESEWEAKEKVETPKIPKKRGRKKKSEVEKEALKEEEKEPEPEKPAEELAKDVKDVKEKGGKKKQGRGRKAKGKAVKEEKIEEDETDKEEETDKEVEEEKEEIKAPKKGRGRKRGRSPKGRKGKNAKAKVEEKEDEEEEDEEEVVPKKKPGKKGRPPKKPQEKEKKPAKIPKKRGRKSKAEKDAELEKKKEIEEENGDATINYSEVESSELFGDSKDSLPEKFNMEKVSDSVLSDKEKDPEVKEVDFSDIRLETEAANSDSETLNTSKSSATEKAEEKRKTDSESSDIGSDFEEDLKPPPAPRPPPMYDSEDGDIESGPENEDMNTSVLSNEPLRDFESSREISREISRDFESSREIDDSVKTSEYINSVETSTPKTPKEAIGTPASVNPYKIDSVNTEHDNPQSHHSSVPHTPSHSSVPNTPATHEFPESRSIEHQTTTGDRIDIKNPIHSQTNDEATDESSMPEVDKDYVGKFFEDLQGRQDQTENQINRMNSMEENSKSQDKSIGTPRSDSGVPSSLNSNQTEGSIQMQSPPADLSHKRIDMISPERPPETHYQQRSESVHNRSSDRISVPPYDAPSYPVTEQVDPYSSTVPPRNTILRQPEHTKPQSLATTTPSFMRFPDSEAMLQRQRLPTAYDRNLQNLHRIAEAPLGQHNSSSPLLRHVPGRDEVFPGTTGVTGSMARNPFHSSWMGQEVRPAHWGHPTYLQQQSGSTTPSLFSTKDPASFLPGREFMFDPTRVAERNMFPGLAPTSHTPRPDIAHDTFHQVDRLDYPSYLGYNTAPSLPVDYTRNATSGQKSLDERYRQSTSGVTDYRSLPPTTSTSDMFGVNSTFNFEKFYSRDPVYHSQHIGENASNPFLPGVASQHTMFGRDYPRSFYTQNPAYPFMNMNDKNYPSAASAKLAHSSDPVGQQRDLVGRSNVSAPDGQLQDPFRHSSMIYNMMNKYY